jgi:hypothetical protein
MKGNLAMLGLAFAVLAAWALTPHQSISDDAAATPPPTATPFPLGETAPMVPLIVIHPGETEELLLSSGCIRITRGTGLAVNPLSAEEFFNAAETCTVGGVTATIDQPTEAEDYPSLVAAGCKSCRLTVTASASAEPGIVDLHLMDDTCGGDCHLDVRVLVVAAE